MNERIFKLAGQAISKVPAPLAFHHEHFLFAEKFAELIVRECIQVLKDTGYPNAHGNCVGVEELEQHFGVDK